MIESEDTSLVAPRLAEAVRMSRRERTSLMRSRLMVAAELKLSQVLADDGAHSRTAQIWEHAILEATEKGNWNYLYGLMRLKRTPVTIDEFCDSKEFLGDLQEIWPKLRPDIRTINPDIFLGAKPVVEACLGGATGTGKTTLCYTTTAYQAYLFQCFHQPQALYKLSPVTPIVFMMQSVSQTITKRIIYRPFRELFTNMPFTQKYLKWDKRRESELILEQGITIVPALANLDAILGQAIAGCMGDEVNFYKLIEDSKQVAGARGKGGLYDQAAELHTNITRRRARSFTTQGYSMGVLCFLSSTRYKNDFLDRRIDDVKKFDIPNVVTLRRKQYEVVPEDGRFCGEKFKLLIGTDDYRTKVIEDDMEPGVDYPETGRFEMVPIEYKDRFQTDPDGALRDIIGIATDTISPFIQQRHKIVEAVVRFQEAGHTMLCEEDLVELSRVGMPQWNEAGINAMTPEMKAHPRFAHIDLSINGDCCGVSVLRLAGFVYRADPDTGIQEVVPHVVVEAAVAIKPSPQREIDTAEVRRWVMQLQNFYGVTIHTVSYDGFQSVESRQALTRDGVRNRLVSMDREIDPYSEVKRALYEDRMDLGPFERVRIELSQLEFHADKGDRGKVDHPPKGSKDVADAIAGALYSIRKSRIVRTEMGSTTSDGRPARDRMGTGRRPDAPRPR